jgi:hypothetical protein
MENVENVILYILLNKHNNITRYIDLDVFLLINYIFNIFQYKVLHREIYHWGYFFLYKILFIIYNIINESQLY